MAKQYSVGSQLGVADMQRRLYMLYTMHSGNHSNDAYRGAAMQAIAV